MESALTTASLWLFLAAVVIGSAVFPTLIVGWAFVPRHLRPKPSPGTRRIKVKEGRTLAEE